MRHSSRAADDVRMRGFAQRQTVEAALGWLDAQLQPLDAEDVSVRHAAGRVLATSVVSPVDGSVSAGQAVRVMTGAPMPRGADAVLPAEWVEADSNCVSALAAVSPEKNVGR